MCPNWRRVGYNRSLKLLERAVKPLFAFHCAGWPPQQQISKELDQLQRRMRAAAIGLRPYPMEPLESFRRRAGRECSQVIGNGWWRALWINSAIRWHEHLKRDWLRQLLHYDDGADTSKLSTSFAWAPAMVATWSAEGIESLRHYATNNARNTRVSRIHRRACAGHVHQRWTEGIKWATAE